jgi:energy-coupling factor transporter ATP-binding protein EcfA2
MVHKELVDKVKYLSTLKKITEKSLSDTMEEVHKLTTVIVKYEKAVELAKNTSAMARERIATHISYVVEMLLNSTYPEKHSFKMEFVERRNQVEIDYFLSYNGNSYQLKKPFVGIGGGKITVISLAMFLAVNNIIDNKILILDEATKMVDNVALEKLSSIVTEYCNTFNRTILLSSPRAQMADAAAEVYNVKKEGLVAVVRRYRDGL